MGIGRLSLLYHEPDYNAILMTFSCALALTHINADTNAAICEGK